MLAAKKLPIEMRQDEEESGWGSERKREGGRDGGTRVAFLWDVGCGRLRHRASSAQGERLPSPALDNVA